MTDDHKSDTMTDTTTTTTTTTSDSKKRKRESDDMDTSPPDIDDSKPRKLLGCMHYISKGKIPSEPYAPPAKPAKEWPFQLDDFQKRSIECLERRENILVSAHTSAGKTVVAEYAIALALQSKSRVIYTSPIKALSNQKYRELKETFEDVGLMTGDINLAPHASCVVMTTEILRNMLYRGSELMREVSWVIFDEVHYMRDRERGVVWEESIILLPPSIHLVFLSATLSNANEFADWIAHLKGYTCHVVSTDYRPVPLCHYVYPKMADGLFLAVDKSGHFRQHNVDEARLIASSQSSGGQRINRSRQPDLIRLLSLCEEKKWLPIICFAFSRRECENGALTVSRLDLLDEDEKALVQQVYERAMDGLTSEDRQLPQVQTLLPLLKRGIGVHHSGLLPILKEIVEILFQESLIKVLFATETFAMGINMPAKTCVFTQLRKFDGKNFRHLSSGEYIQMSGRAGRRGTDEQGICILMIDDKIETETIREMCLGASDPLISRFRLSYNMILNLMRAGTSNDPTHVIENSLHQFQYISSLPNLTSRVNELESTLRNLRDNDDDEHIQAIESYFQIKGLVSDIRDQLRVHMMRPSILLPFLQPGRVVYIKNLPASIPIEDDAQSDATEREAAAKKRAKILAEQNAREDFGWGIVINFRKRWSPDGYAVDVLLPVRDIQRQGKLVIPIPEKQGHESDYVTSTGISRSERQVLILCVMATMIHEISAIRVYCPNDLRSPVARRTLYDTLVEVKNNFPSGEFPLLTPDDMDIFRTSTSESNQSEVKQLQSRLQVLEQRLAMSPIAKLPLKEQKKAFEKYEKRLTIQTELKQVKSHARQSLVVVYQAELKQRLRVMRRLGFVDDEGVILQKGRVAAEIESADELLVTELMFDGTFSTLDPAQICALMTCLFDMDKLRNERPLHSDLQSCYNTLQSTAKRVAQICMECQLPIQEEIYLASFKSSMMNITYAWCRGASFTAICQMTEMFEGSIIRIMRRLEELLRQLRAAAKSIGNEELDAKFEAGSKMLMRGVMFAGSLYL